MSKHRHFLKARERGIKASQTGPVEKSKGPAETDEILFTHLFVQFDRRTFATHANIEHFNTQ